MVQRMAAISIIEIACQFFTFYLFLHNLAGILLMMVNNLITLLAD
jgi:hypothetical protein